MARTAKRNLPAKKKPPPKIDLEPFQKGVNEAAARVRGLWLGYVALLAYLFITVGTVTHQDLLLENPVKLPVLNVELPLIGFFAVAPVFFFINHFYLLLQLLGLGRRIRWYNDEIAKTGLGAEARRGERIKLDTFVIVQMLGGTKEERSGLTGLFLRVIAVITLVIAPLLLLLGVQISFLPYHHEAITWLHRLTVIADLVLLWLFWPAIQSGTWMRLRLPQAAFAAAMTVLTIVFSAGLATFPGEMVHRDKIVKIVDCTIGIKFDDGENDKAVCMGAYYPLRDGLFAGPIDQVKGTRRSIFSNALSLPDATLIDVGQLEKIMERHTKLQGEKDPWTAGRTLSLRGRNLRGAVFDRADLRNTDLLDAKLQGASLWNARLQGASLDRANLQGASLDRASLQGASLWNAKLQGASLDRADLQGALLRNASLQGASLDRASLQGASLGRASLQDAWLNRAKLQGALLDRASLQGASLPFASLQGASLRNASLQGASLWNAKLQGASLWGAKLQGALLDRANLQGAALEGASLQGASLDHASLQGASLYDAKLQGASLKGAKLHGASLNGTFLWRVYGMPLWRDSEASDKVNSSLVWVNKPQLQALTFEQLAQVKKDALEGVESEVVGQRIKAAIAVLSARQRDLKKTLPPNYWTNLESKLSEADHRKDLAYRLMALACGNDNAPYVAQALITDPLRGVLSPILRPFRARLEQIGNAHLPRIARTLLDAANGKTTDCPGVKGLNAASITILSEWAAMTEN